MIRIEFVTLVLAIRAASAINLFDKNITWWGGENLVVYQNNDFVSKNIWATRTVIYEDHAFLVLPRDKPGVPITLARMSLEGLTHTQTAFPSWEMQEIGNCTALQNVVDIFLDPRGILWVLDDGTIERFDHNCSPKIVSINAKTGKVEKTIPITMEAKESVTMYIVADYNPEGHQFVYVSVLESSEIWSRAILVFDVFNDENYHVQLPILENPKIPEFIQISLLRTNNGNYLVINYQFEERMFWVSCSFLQNGSAEGKLVDIGHTGGLDVLGADNAGSIFFRKYNEFDVYRYNMIKRNSLVTLLYKGNSDMRATHVVLDNKRGGIGVLESDNMGYLIDDKLKKRGASHSLILIGGYRRRTSSLPQSSIYRFIINVMKTVLNYFRKIMH